MADNNKVKSIMIQIMIKQIIIYLKNLKSKADSLPAEEYKQLIN